MAHGRLSLIILAHNKAAMTAACLRSLLACSYRPLEIVFVNNGSTDRTRKLLDAYAGHAASAGLELQILDYPTNSGCITPRNEGMARCRGDWIGLMDNDTLIRSRDIFERLTRFLRDHPRVGAVAPKFVYPASPFRIQSAGGGVTREGRCYLIGRGAPRDAVEYNSVCAVPWVISACMVMPRRIVEKVGPLDRVYHPIAFEDTDYCFRIRAAGHDVVYVPGAELYHVENTSTYGTPLLRYEAVTRRNQAIFRRRWRHMFPSEPRLKDLPTMHIPQPRVPLWELQSLPTVS